MLKAIFLKVKHEEPMVSVEQISFTVSGLVGNVPCLLKRQVLLLPKRVIDEKRIAPSELRENLLLDYDELHDLPSGTVLRVGEAKICLTFLCEVCGKVKGRISQNQRGYLGQLLNEGTLRLGDDVENLGVQFPAIPTGVKERVIAVLSRQPEKILSTDLLDECGLSRSYARALPRLLSGAPEPVRNRVIFKSKTR
jgi:MOSC domain-containing protein YiiM